MRTPGITPAHAGKTAEEMVLKTVHEDHPRACGENLTANSSSHAWTGSPPRMRGKPWNRISLAMRQRITPAHAGKTASFAYQTVALWDHPRACGENMFRVFFDFLQTGSPPRMRGKLPLQRLYRQTTGITPAHAGKTVILYLGAIQCQDHPRACGENEVCPCEVDVSEGSPPRMRGKLV